MRDPRTNARGEVTDPRPVPTPSVWGVLFAIIVPVLYTLWVHVAIPVSGAADDVSTVEELSFTIMRVVVLAFAFGSIALGLVGVRMVRHDPHLYRNEWVGWLAVGLGFAQVITLVGGWIGSWPQW